MKGSDVEDNDDRFNEIGTANRFSTAVATPASNIPHKKQCIMYKARDIINDSEPLYSVDLQRSSHQYVKRLNKLV